MELFPMIERIIEIKNNLFFFKLKIYHKIWLIHKILKCFVKIGKHE